MPDFTIITLVVLGAGLAKRFGSDKLAADLDGCPVASHLLRTVTPLPFAQKLVVARGQSWTSAYAAAGFSVLENVRPELGPGASLALAVEAAEHPALLICLADMPFVTASHLSQLIESNEKTSGVVVTRGETYRGPPAIIPRRLLETRDLVKLGARSLLAEAQTAVLASRQTLRDVDTPDDLASYRSVF